jgi:tRNA threonylcarbamoyl adenosine modification protein (Sua5/YciO/YrdC/YwlC family)
MLLKIYPENPELTKILKAVETLRKDGVIVVPTDTVYALCCDIHNQKAADKISRIKGVKLEDANFSFICYDLSTISEFTRQFDTSVYKLMRRSLPGPYTFILHANHNVPSIFRSKKKTIGIRVPDNSIVREIVKELGNPLMATSIHHEDALVDYMTDPSLIHDTLTEVDAVIDGGPGGNEPSTIIDCTGSVPLIVREGKGVDLLS